MKNKPPYPLQSVDHALQLLQLLRDNGTLRVSEAAEELGTARSTAHRLLAMLVYRDFAVQDEARNYLPGPALSAPQAIGGRVLELRRLLRPHMETLCDTLQETVNLLLRVGTETRFVASVECSQTLRVGDRRGLILPAAISSGGRAMLADLTPQAVAELYATTGQDQHTDMAKLLRHLAATRRRGYAINDQETEAGVSAMAVCLRDNAGDVVAALAIAVPSVRFTRDRQPVLATALRETAERVKTDLTATQPPTGR
ncbi:MULTISPECIES: IclR family transcriptional regulator [unclassified Crossiella]|uniref:IclR family transcriptional regulator n=1 Tax=unclassified Crossiella TaxID=2620835 RepID=UPI001FFF0BA5|nr:MULTISPECIES: IclR family transcriptional regulator [unclassified Crossiella]MCK2244635.1 IclR family transcriptional regulator [Crossiella sp. S99.2]MCK2258378.1 IclR family transcriptional regulator [Crossiella sp. S99.1]